ncbi:RagB/SusD family nutrient uptake outer membrane protein [Ferruginibacter sp.]|uniref:RagB/SusD family nutrient uptake outer membrane protein n=1 Tax=Ferruginibacter sp. TaxID=1940288 RepID=UPI00374D3BA4
MKKNIVQILLLLLFFFSIAGCKKFITKDIVGQYPESQFYTTQAQALLAINAAYQPLGFTTANNNRLWVFGDVASNDAAKGGNPGDQADIEFIDQFTINSTNGNLASMWALLYDGIARCNIVLSKVPAITMNKNIQTRILGEAKFLRAWYYFELINIFGDVPLVLQPLGPDQLQVAQSPVQLIFETVIEIDLIDAAANLPATYSGADVGRATAGAATALLAKAYLFESKWDKAATASGKIVNGKLYNLMLLYSQNFSAKFKNNQESVFEVQHLTGQDPKLGNELNQYFAPQVDGGYYFNAPTQNFVDEFEKTGAGIIDPRLDYTVGRDSMPWFNNRIFDKAWSQSTGYLTRKHQQSLAEVPNKSDGNINYIAIRYADVLLWYAEALNESGHSAAALLPLNTVRKRARESYLYDTGKAGYPNIPTDLLPDILSTNQVDLRKAIQHERRVELGFEFHRYFDIIRWGKDYATQSLKDKPNFNYDLNKHFPIPQIERDRNKALH